LVTTLPASTLAQLTTCEILVQDLTVERYVHGNVVTECPGGVHSAPFGNWGVDSNHGWRNDLFQFAGWLWDDDKLQWNSCTTHEDYDPPDCGYYTLSPDACTTQYSPDPYVFANWWSGPLPWNCTDTYPPIYTMNNYWMNIRELDPGGTDQLVASVEFPSFNVALSGGIGYYFGWSDDIAPSSVSSPWGPNLTAKLRVFVQMVEYGEPEY
jgi:hypothetical protein